MILTLSHSEMLHAWRQAAGVEAAEASGCSVSRFDSLDIDAMLAADMRRWYLALLDSGDPALLGPPSPDAAPLVGLRPSGVGGYAVLDPAPPVRRLCSLRLSPWRRDALVTDSSIALAWLALQGNPYAAAGPCRPVAYRRPCGETVVTPACASDTVVQATAYIDPGPDSYILDERALATIPRLSHLLS